VFLESSEKGPGGSGSGPLKIGVLTFHRCVNYGSYWQARCLVEGLRSRGHDAVLLDYVCAQTNKTEWRCAMQPLLPRRSPREAIRLYARKARAFEAAVDALPVSDRFPLAEPELMQDCDVVVIGSDEVWNLSHPWFGGNALFWGHGLRAPRLISYAASFGNYDADAGIDSFWSSQLRNFHRISVRDDNSRRLVQAALDLEPVMVLDPVLQFPPELDESSGWSERAPYAVLYGHSFSDDFARAIRAWADRRGLPLVSLGYVNDWADEQCIDADPIAFAHAMSQAQSVVTSSALPDAEPIGDTGDPAMTIVDAAHAHQVDVIVIGHEDRSWFSRLVEGSVSKNVIRESDIPVLVVPYAEKPAKQEGDAK